MPIEVKTTTIGPLEYSVTQLDGVRGRKAFVRLLNMTGPLSNIENPKELLKLVSDLKESDMDYFCDLFGPMTEVRGGVYGAAGKTLVPAVFMTHFAGNYFELVEWLVFCVQANFQSFFDQLRALLATLAPPVPQKVSVGLVASPSSSPTASTGSSGAS